MARDRFGIDGRGQTCYRSSVSKALTGLVVTLVAAACGGSGDDHAVADAAPVPIDAAPGSSRAAIVAGAGSGGVLSTLSTGAMVVSANRDSGGVVGADPIVRHLGHELFVVNRGGTGALSVLDDTALTVTTTLAPHAGSQPQDVAAVGDKLYVVERAGTGVERLTRGSAASVDIDLSADDPDGNPNCTSAIALGPDVYVACGLLDDATGAPRGNAKVYVIDSATDTVRTSFDLTTKAPSSLLEAVGDGTLAIATNDASANNSGCIEHITPGAAPSSQCITRNIVLAGFATRIQFQIFGDSMFLWMAVTGTDDSALGTRPLMAFDVTSSEAWQPISTPGEIIGDAALCPDGTVVLSELAPAAQGLRAYQLAVEITTAPLAVGLPPTSSHGIECY